MEFLIFSSKNVSSVTPLKSACEFSPHIFVKAVTSEDRLVLDELIDELLKLIELLDELVELLDVLDELDDELRLLELDDELELLDVELDETLELDELKLLELELLDELDDELKLLELELLDELDDELKLLELELTELELLEEFGQKYMLKTYIFSGAVNKILSTRDPNQTPFNEILSIRSAATSS
jgi:hypothetical protein